MKRRNFLKLSLPIALTGKIVAEAAETKGGSEKPLLTFGVIADPQYADIPAKGSRHYRGSIAKLNAAVKELNGHSLDFVVTLGDVIDRDFSSFKKIMPIYETLKAPRRFVLGNHDLEVADEDKEKVMGALGMKKSYYSETIKGWHFIYLDGTDVSTYRYPKGAEETKEAEKVRQGLKKEGVIQANSWNGTLGADQLKWLKSELEKATLGKKRVIIFNHFPTFPLRDPHNLWNDEQLIATIAPHLNVIAYMNGHNHKGNYARHKSCHYVNFKGMVETENTSAYGIVSCYDDRIEIDGFGVEPDRSLSKKG